MNHYFCIFRVPTAVMDDWRANTPPEEMKKQGEKLGAEMVEWTGKHKASLVGEGYPLGKTKTVTQDGVRDGRNDLNYACIVQAESHEAAAAIFADCPHSQIPSSSIDVMEIPHAGM